MIVRDKTASILKADEAATKLLRMIRTECHDFNAEDDPAEQIYLGVHILGNLLAKMCVALSGYGETYAIANVMPEKTRDWILVISKEHLAAREV